jgi:hypothetical protein
MSNKYAAYAHRIPMGTYWSMLRFCRDAHPTPVLDGEGKPKVFSTKAEAVEECLKHVLAYMNGRPIRSETFEHSDYSIRSARRETAERMLKEGIRGISE